MGSDGFREFLVVRHSGLEGHEFSHCEQAHQQDRDDNPTGSVQTNKTSRRASWDLESSALREFRLCILTFLVCQLFFWCSARTAEVVRIGYVEGPTTVVRGRALPFIEGATHWVVAGEGTCITVVRNREDQPKDNYQSTFLAMIATKPRPKKNCSTRSGSCLTQVH